MIYIDYNILISYLYDSFTANGSRTHLFLREYSQFTEHISAPSHCRVVWYAALVLVLYEGVGRLDRNMSNVLCDSKRLIEVLLQNERV